MKKRSRTRQIWRQNKTAKHEQQRKERRRRVRALKEKMKSDMRKKGML